MNRRIRMIAATAGALLAVGVNARAADVPYISGGVGADEREAFAAKEKEYNLKIVVAEKSGDYLGDVQVGIESAGKRRILETAMEGPILLAKLPPGTYRITATSGRDRLTQTVNVPPQGLREVILRWEVSRKSAASDDRPPLKEAATDGQNPSSRR
jgi:hypothetical protein